MPAVCKRASSFVRRKIPRLPADRPIIPIDFINRDAGMTNFLNKIPVRLRRDRVAQNAPRTNNPRE